MSKWLSRWRIALPSVVTLLGLFLSGCWLAGASWHVGLVGLLCDAIDGKIARKTGTVSSFGSLLDWVTDVVVLAVLLGRLELWPAALLSVPWQVALRHFDVRFSGRAAVTMGVIVLQMAGKMKGWAFDEWGIGGMIAG